MFNDSSTHYWLEIRGDDNQGYGSKLNVSVDGIFFSIYRDDDERGVHCAESRRGMKMLLAKMIKIVPVPTDAVISVMGDSDARRGIVRSVHRVITPEGKYAGDEGASITWDWYETRPDGAARHGVRFEGAGLATLQEAVWAALLSITEIKDVLEVSERKQKLYNQKHRHEIALRKLRDVDPSLFGSES